MGLVMSPDIDKPFLIKKHFCYNKIYDKKTSNFNNHLPAGRSGRFYFYRSFDFDLVWPSQKARFLAAKLAFCASLDIFIFIDGYFPIFGLGKELEYSSFGK